MFMFFVWIPAFAGMTGRRVESDGNGWGDDVMSRRVRCDENS
jgi:hypothetical protein